MIIDLKGQEHLALHRDSSFILNVDELTSGGGGGGGSADLLIPITYSELKSKRDSSTLTPGMQYRITDYQCTSNAYDTSVANNVFDIIVVADSTSVLNENARAIQHDGDTYFRYNNLKEWELKYTIDNNTGKFAWADSENGKGVIYWMKDEFNNECPYDFKNILMKLYKAPSDASWIPSGLRGKYCVMQKEEYGSFSIMPPDDSGIDASTVYTDYTYLYTFGYSDYYQDYSNNYYVNNNIVEAYEQYGRKYINFVHTAESCDHNKFTNSRYTYLGYGNNNVFETGCYGNVFANSCSNNILKKSCSNNIFDSNCENNVFENGCYSNRLGRSSSKNIFGVSCHDNILGEVTNSNILGDICWSNVFGNYCTKNIFGKECRTITLGYSCIGNSFDSDCYDIDASNRCTENKFGFDCNYITFGANCYSNIFSNNCANITFGNNCEFNTIGNGCEYIVFGNSSNPKSYYKSIIIEDLNKYICLDTNQTTSYNAYIQNIKITQGVNNTDQTKTIMHNTTNDTYQTTYQPTNSETISV